MLEKYITGEEYRGYDPFDALTSPVFGFPLLRSSKILRLVAQQIMKRLPFNIRSLIGIKKGYNPVTLGLCIQGYSYLISAFPENSKNYLGLLGTMVDELLRLSSIGFSGFCWGYDFDWEARYAKINAFEPTVVATGIVVNGLSETRKLIMNHKLVRECDGIMEVGTDEVLNEKGEKEFIKRIEGMIVSAAEFVRKDLRKSVEEDVFCYSYSAVDEQKVLNASMKGVRVLVQAYEISKDEELIEEADKAVRFVVKKQRGNGSWGYAVGDTRSWSDSFHTGYILDCLKDYIDLTGKEEFKVYLDNGFEFFRKSFVEEDGFPKYYDYEKYPADCTSAGQIILTMLKFGFIDDALMVANWMMENMQDKKGYFYFQKKRHFTNRISYMRWSNAWMFASLSKLLMQLKILKSLEFNNSSKYTNFLK